MSADAATSKGTPGAGRGSLTVLLLASTLGVMGGATIAPVIEVIRQALDVGGTEAGLVLTSHSLAIALGSPLVGRATDRFGVRLPLAAGLVVYGLSGGAAWSSTPTGSCSPPAWYWAWVQRRCSPAPPPPCWACTGERRATK
ncbi:MFS transporter [Streptomyces sp. TRM68367]|uniref:MFS transporter n=1 Tax=Streptomyces sp. TRM68367 TaxID=2758415 RepID=UPI001CA82A7D|nr:MFS transporter [Streptomyces sp. TRM68367]